MDINEAYSYKDFTGQTFLDVDPDEFSLTEIVGSCFAQEVPYNSDASHNGSVGHVNPEVDVFPVGMHEVIFTGCNLDNCKIPGPPTMINGGSHRKIRVMNDLEDWVLDNTNHRPVEPVGKSLFQREGLSIDPADISTVKRNTPITHLENS